MDAPRRRNPSGNGATRPGSRSSRRILSGTPVELGGGVGILGTAMAEEQTPMYSYNLWSPTDGGGPSKPFDAPPPLPPKSSKKAAPTSASGLPSSAWSAGSVAASGSGRSLTTNGSTSESPAIKTPHARAKHQPGRGGSGDSTTSPASIAYYDRASTERSRPIPAMAQGPLPQPPPVGSIGKAQHKTATRGQRKVPAPIRTDQLDGRASNDWVRVDEFGDLVSDFAPGRPAPAPASNHATAPPSTRAGGMEDKQRSATDPVARRSNDLLRTYTPSLASGVSDSSSAGRRTPLSMEAAERRRVASSTVIEEPQPQKLKPRRSFDMLRPSGDVFGRKDKEAKAAPQRALGVEGESRKSPAITLKKSSGALRNLFRGKAKEVPEVPGGFQFGGLLRANPNLSNSSTPIEVSAPFQPGEMPADSPGRASFSHDRPYPASLPLTRAASHDGQISPPRVQRTEERRIPPPRPLELPGLDRGALTDARKPAPMPLQQPVSDQSRQQRPQPQLEPSAQQPQQQRQQQQQPPQQAQRQPPPQLPQLAQGSQRPQPQPSAIPFPSASGAPYVPSLGNPATAPIPVPPAAPAPIGPTAARTYAQASRPHPAAAFDPLPPRSTSRDALDSSQRGDGVAGPSTASEAPAKAVSPVGSDGGGSSGSTSTVRQLGESPSKHSLSGSTPELPSMPSSTSLRLLQLPELDLALDFSFDTFGPSSPTTPRKRSPHGSNPGTPSRSRATSTSRVVTSPGTREQRRRSKSFDGLGMADEPWRSLSFDAPWNGGKLFATPASSSVPRLSSKSKQPELPAAPPTAAASSVDSLTTSSSCDHARTPSGGSSTNETSSPSPPRTPEDAHSAFLAGEKKTSLEAPVALNGGLDTPIGIDPFGRYSPATTVDVTPTASEQATPTKIDLSTPRAEPPQLSSEQSTPKASATQEKQEFPGMARRPTAERKESARREAEQKLSGHKDEPKAKEPRAKDGKATAPMPKSALKAPSPPKPRLMVVIHPNPAKPPRELEEPPEPEQLPAKQAPFQCRPTARQLLSEAKIVIHDPKITLRSLTHELERSLDNFRYPMQGNGPACSLIVRNELLTYVQEIDRRCYNRRDELVYRDLREVCFDWADSLLFELRVEQPANERGACLEGLGAILESQALSAEALEASPSHQDAFLHLMMRVMNFVMDKLGSKGVFHNTLLFSGRFLAFAFFRVPHVGGQLVGVLQPPRGALMRFTRSVLIGKRTPREAQPHYPEHLQALCFDDSQSYTRRLLKYDPVFETAAEKEAFHFQPGNWLRRWQSDDSELFPAFYRAYHKQLAQYLAPAVGYYQLQGKPVPAHVLMRAPGYAHLATIFGIKCHSYILGSVNAVTTSSSNQQFDMNESAGFRGAQKPAVLETANRRLVETLWMFASHPITMPTPDQHVIQCDGAQLWGEMIDIWMKGLISKTSLYAPKGVFCLFDMLDGLVDPVVYNDIHSPLDVPYIIGLVRTILNEGEHALTLVKAIAFVFTHWEILTARPEDRRELCMEILLKKTVFERLLLFWSQSVRSYVLRLVVFRLGHLHTTKADGLAYEVEMESVRLLNTRLDRIKKRYDELEPLGGEPEITNVTPRTPTTPRMPRSRSTITMVADSPKPSTKAEKLLGLGLGAELAEEKEGKGKASWWKRTLGKQKKTPRSGVSPKLAQAPSLADSSPIIPSPRHSRASSGGSSPRPGSTGSGHSGRSGPPGAGPTAPSPRPPSKLSETSLSSPRSPRATEPAATSSPRLGPSLMPPDNPRGGGPSSPRPPRKSPPPNISTDSGPRKAVSDAKAAFAFEFELPTASPLSDAFDQSATSPRRTSQPPSPRGPTSPHMSQSFSKRSSLLPPPAANALNDSLKAAPPVPPIERDPGYPKRLHAYAIRMLAELEDAQKEYDEWWSEGGIGKVDGAPPRLAVAWPFHEGEEY